MHSLLCVSVCRFFTPQNGPVDTPWCFYGQTTPPQYNVQSIQQQANGFTASITLSNPGAGTYGPAIPKLQLTAVYETAERVHFRLTDAVNARYEIPQSILPYPQEGSRDFPSAGTEGSYDAANPQFSVSTSQVGQALSLTVTRTQDGTKLFDMGALEYSDQYLQLITNLPDAGAPILNGLGEHVMNFLLPTDDHTFTMWDVDIPTPWDQNEYGSHPFLVQTLAESGLAHGLFVRSSAGMDVITSTSQVQFRLIGGILEWYIFVGPTHEQVFQQYHAVIGRPHLPPYWSLGWHQCKYGWHSLQEVETVVATYAQHEIPLDTIWGDIDYMDAYQDFTWDPVNFPLNQVREFADQLHSNGQHYTVIVDPGIRNITGYAPYDQGLEMNVFITEADGRTPYIGTVWPGTTAFPDFLHVNGTEYWTQQVSQFLSGVNYDGLWIDMNEISNFQNGGSFDPNAAVNNPPYAINNFASKASLDTKTLPMDALHASGNYREYDVHNLYGLSEAIATKIALEKAQGVRSFVLSRSTFPSSGVHTSHWLGDNHATWQDMWRSIPGILNMQMYGVPMVGADICGFLGATTEELCARWSAMGAFYTFSRNHHEPQESQEPYLWPSVEAVSKRVLSMRYSLLPTLYTLMNSAHLNGGTVLRHLMWNYPRDIQTYSIDSQWMWGSALLITPVLTEGSVSVKGYWPPASIWYDAWNLTALTGVTDGWAELPCSLAQGVLLHIAGGSILPTQTPALTTAASRLNPFGLTIAFDASGYASGSLFWDDGSNLIDGANALSVQFNASVGTLGGVNWSVVSNTFTGKLPSLQTVTVAGIKSNPTGIAINGQLLSPSAWTFDAQRNVLVINPISVNLAQTGSIQWKF
jgi:alpha-glucosidase